MTDQEDAMRITDLLMRKSDLTSRLIALRLLVKETKAEIEEIDNELPREDADDD